METSMAPFTFFGGIIMTKDIPFIAHMVIIKENNFKKDEKRIDNSYYNAELDSESEYCMNTTAWD